MDKINVYKSDDTFIVSRGFPAIYPLEKVADFDTMEQVESYISQFSDKYLCSVEI